MNKTVELKIMDGAIACATDEIQTYPVCLVFSANDHKISRALAFTKIPTARNVIQGIEEMVAKYPEVDTMITYLLPRSQMMKTSTVYEINNTTGQSKVVIDANASPQQQVEAVMKMVETEAIEFHVGAQMIADAFMNADLRMIGVGGCNDPECFNCRLITKAVSLIPIEKRPKRVSLEALDRINDEQAKEIDMRMVGSMGSYKGTMH
jgi:hypothetical protein